MDDATARELASRLAFAAMVNRVMPVDEEADRRAARAMREYNARQPARKLVQRRRPAANR
jgi:hypothetical protein